MVRKKINPDDINEDFIIASVKKDVVKDDNGKEEQPKSKPAKKKHKTKTGDYISVFISNPGIKARSGKLIYIRPEYHERISKIVKILGADDFSIFGYIDNVLTQHFEEYQDEMLKNYNERTGLF